MLIPIRVICRALNANFKTILHVGAHLGEEMRDYIGSGNGLGGIFWIESEYNLCERLNKVILESASGIKQEVMNATIWNQDGIVKKFYKSDHSMSNSLLEPKVHLEAYPEIEFNKIEYKITSKLDTILGLRTFDFVNLDIQGAELEALKGFENGLQRNVRLIYTEVNKDELYSGCSKLTEVNGYLRSFNFRLIGVVWERSGWGDAVFIRDDNQFNKFRILLLKVSIEMLARKVQFKNLFFSFLRTSNLILRKSRIKINAKKND